MNKPVLDEIYEKVVLQNKILSTVLFMAKIDEQNPMAHEIYSFDTARSRKYSDINN